MAARVTKKAPQSSNVSPPLLVAAVVGLVLFMGLLVWHYFIPHSEAVHPRPLTAGESWLAQKARESQGDFNRLSPEDKQRLIMTAGPSGPASLRMTYTMQHKQ